MTRDLASPEAEQSVLGSILLDQSALEQVIDQLKPEDFYYETHELVYRAMLAVRAAGKPPDLTTIVSHLHDLNQLEAVGGLAFLAELSEHVGTAANIRYYAHEVVEKARLRRLVKLGAETQAKIDLHTNPDEVLSWLLGNCVNLLAESTLEQEEYIGKIVGAVRQKLEDMWYSKLPPGVMTGFLDIDNFLGGLHPKNLILLAARPSMGKSALALNIAYNVARRGLPVGIISLEMSKEQFGARMVASVGRINLEQIINCNLSPIEWANISDVEAEVESLPIVVDDRSRVLINDIQARCYRWRQTYNLGLVIIDYLQLIRDEKRKGNREAEVAETSQKLKSLAKELEIPILALCQLNREVEKRTDKRPILADLRESGALEQDADVVLMLYRDEFYNPESDLRGVAELFIRKNRNGRTGKMFLQFTKEYTLFQNYISEPERRPYEAE